MTQQTQPLVSSINGPRNAMPYSAPQALEGWKSGAVAHHRRLLGRKTISSRYLERDLEMTRTMALQELSELMLPALESELRRQVDRLDQPISKPFHEMLAYHMGWSGAQPGGPAAGKRIRPLVMLLVAKACGAEWLHAVSCAAAVELVHNFSLVHDDIEDNSPTRRGRVTVWKKYGGPMAINVEPGDARCNRLLPGGYCPEGRGLFARRLPCIDLWTVSGHVFRKESQHLS
jgi:hypothetical protein